MKRFAITAAALALSAGFASAADAQQWRDQRGAPARYEQPRVEQWDARRHNGYVVQGRFFAGRPNAAAMRHPSYRPVFQAQRWDGRQHNGYTYQGRWYYGEPSRAIMQHRTFEPGYRTWRRGDRLTSYHRQHYRAVDYRRERLQPPPRGYQYVRSDRGETLLVGIATGVILGVILGAN